MYAFLRGSFTIPTYILGKQSGEKHSRVRVTAAARDLMLQQFASKKYIVFSTVSLLLFCMYLTSTVLLEPCRQKRL